MPYSQIVWRIFNRICKQWGITNYMAIILIILLFVGLSLLCFEIHEYGKYGYVLLSFQAFLFLGQSSKNQFLKWASSKQKYRKIRIIENVLTASAFSLFLIYFKEYNLVFLTVLSAVILAFWDNQFGSNKALPSPFAKFNWEFNSGFRVNFILHFVFIILWLVGIFIANYNLSLVSILSFYLLIGTHFQRLEPIEYLWNYRGYGKQIVKRKLLLHLSQTLKWILPLSLILVFLKPSLAIYLLAINTMGILLICLIILLKFQQYPYMNPLLQTLILAACICFFPLFFVLIPYYFSKSIENINYYLNAKTK